MIVNVCVNGNEKIIEFMSKSSAKKVGKFCNNEKLITFHDESVKKYPNSVYISIFPHNWTHDFSVTFSFKSKKNYFFIN